MTEPDWRDDPAWFLVEYNAEAWGDKPPGDRPTAQAELAQPDSWASQYKGGAIIATWSRTGGVR